MCLAANIIEMNKNENYPVRKSQNNGDRMAEIGQGLSPSVIASGAWQSPTYRDCFWVLEMLFVMMEYSVPIKAAGGGHKKS